MATERSIFCHQDSTGLDQSHMPASGSGNFTSDSGDSSGLQFQSRDGGYDLDFVVRDEKYDCPICLLVLREPYQTQCGHRFCHKCIYKWLRESEEARCPIDNSSLGEGQLFPDNFAKREILGLQVRCPNQTEGCDRIVVLKQLKNHIKECLFVPVPCPNKCSHILLRKDLDHHVKDVCHKRQLSCPLCHYTVMSEHLQYHNLNECLLAMVECQFCSKELMREQLSRHQEHDCMKITIDCPFKKIGCPIGQIPRCEMGKHKQEQIQMHMQLMCDVLVELRNLHLRNIPINQQTKSMPPIGSEPTTPTSACGPDSAKMNVLSTLNTLNLGLNECIAQISMNPSLSQQNRNLVQGLQSTRTMDHFDSNMGLRRNDDSFSGLTQEVSEVNYTSHPSNNLQGAPRVPLQSFEFQSLKNQNDKQDESLARHEFTLADVKQKTDQFDKNNSMLLKRIKTLEGVVNDFEGKACNGMYVWKIKNYAKFRREAELGETTAIHSPAFFSACYGYKLCIRANLNGVDSARGTHLSIFIHFMQGEYDDILDWPFTGRIILTVMDQNSVCELRHHVMETLMSKPNLAAFQKPTTPRNHKGFGYMEFLPLGILDNSTYVKNDCLIIKAHVIQNGNHGLDAKLLIQNRIQETDHIVGQNWQRTSFQCGIWCAVALNQRIDVESSVSLISLLLVKPAFRLT